MDWIRKNNCVEVVKTWIKVSGDVGNTNHTEDWEGKCYMYTKIPLTDEDLDEVHNRVTLMHPPSHTQGAVGRQEPFTHTKDSWNCNNPKYWGVNRMCDSIFTQCHTPSANHPQPQTASQQVPQQAHQGQRKFTLSSRWLP